MIIFIIWLLYITELAPWQPLVLDAYLLALAHPHLLPPARTPLHQAVFRRVYEAAQAVFLATRAASPLLSSLTLRQYRKRKNKEAEEE